MANGLVKELEELKPRETVLLFARSGLYSDRAVRPGSSRATRRRCDLQDAQ
jgi:hypothetical protein